jgi:hypothetical protein
MLKTEPESYHVTGCGSAEIMRLRLCNTLTNLCESSAIAYDDDWIALVERNLI